MVLVIEVTQKLDDLDDHRACGEILCWLTAAAQVLPTYGPGLLLGNTSGIAIAAQVLQSYGPWDYRIS